MNITPNAKHTQAQSYPGMTINRCHAGVPGTAAVYICKDARMPHTLNGCVQRYDTAAVCTSMQYEYLSLIHI